MIDPFTAIGLASSIVQFVDFSSKLLVEGYGAYKSAAGATETQLEMEHATRDLASLAARLKIPHRIASAKPTVDDIKLDELAKQSQQLAKQLLDYLDELKVKGAGAMRTWEAVRKTVKRQWESSRIVEMRRRLDRIQDNLNSHLLGTMHNAQSSVMSALRELEISSRRIGLAELNHIDSLRSEVQSAVDLQIESMKAAAAISDKQSEAHLAAMRRYEESLSHLTQRLDSVQRDGSTIATGQKILESLMFPELYTRHKAIHKNYPKTFSWIFDGGQTPFKAWLESRDGVFWINGKAGSGKSTLMKCLADHPQSDALLETWAKATGQKLVRASFYFWHGGTAMQKSQEGLMQSLLYQILRQCPTLIPLASARRWNADEEFHHFPEPWSPDELSEALKAITEAGGHQLSARFCFFVDGLDEYIGDHGKLVEDLANLTQGGHIKLCVSSRPWTVFVDAYSSNKAHTLVVQDLTKPDMDMYINGILEKDARFQKLASRDDRAWRLVSEVRERAEGVFLWVFLVVRSLLRGMSEKNDLETLEMRLSALPSDLKEYFTLMVKTIDPIHQEHTAGTFQLAIHAAPLPLIAFYFLPVVLKDPDSIIKAPIEYVGDEEEFITKTSEKINAWCKDLLEVHKVSDASGEAVNELDYKVDFLHRTVKDFLIENLDIQEIFSQRIRTGFEPWLTLVRLHIAQAKDLNIKFGDDRDVKVFAGVANDLMYFASRHEDVGKVIPPSLLKELDRIGQHFRKLPHRSSPAVKRMYGQPSHWASLCPVTHIDYLLAPGNLGQCDLLSLAVAYNLEAYTRWHLSRNPDAISSKVGWPLLNYTLHPVASNPSRMDAKRLPSYDMVLLLLNAGAEPNTNGELRKCTVWQLYLHRCYQETDSRLWPVAKLLLAFDADPGARIQVGTRHETTYVALTQKVRSPRQRAVPVLMDVREVLGRCCVGEQVQELEEALEAARARQAAKEAAMARQGSFWNRLRAVKLM